MRHFAIFSVTIDTIQRRAFYGYIISESVRLKQVHILCVFTQSIFIARTMAWRCCAICAMVYLFVAHYCAKSRRRPYRDDVFSPAVPFSLFGEIWAYVRGFISCPRQKPSASLPSDPREGGRRRPRESCGMNRCSDFGFACNSNKD